MKRHRADLLSLAFGIVFVAVAGTWAAGYYLNWNIEWNVPNLGWIVAGGLIMIGLLGVVASLRGNNETQDDATMPSSPFGTGHPVGTEHPTSTEHTMNAENPMSAENPIGAENPMSTEQPLSTPQPPGTDQPTDTVHDVDTTAEIRRE